MLPGPFLAFQLKHIGDFLMTLPALGFIKQHSDHKTGLVLSPKIAELARGHPWVDEIFVLDRRRGLPALWNLARSLRPLTYRSALVFDGQTRSIVAAALAGLKNLVGAGGLYPQGGWSWLYTRDLDIVDQAWPLESQAYRGQKLAAAALGRPAGPPLRPPAPPLSEAERFKARELTAALAGQGPLVGLTLAGLQPEKTWPLPNFADLCRRLWSAFGARLFVTGGPDESPLAQALARASGTPVADFCGRTALKDLLALAEISDLFITIDTGASHIVALTETPLISIFVWTSPALWPPQSPRARILCYDWALARFGLKAGDGPWLSAPVVTPEMVFQEAAKILNNVVEQ
ncbi:MAG: glycosyltransferase family 9 protein [Candidatus Adiutrix sp.]|jgi:ADP-heptose:LPS heptosyltransferase|nr:glycosyltransferase family 9 protein [Candidatus Adiutrix sp.]